MNKDLVARHLWASRIFAAELEQIMRPLFMHSLVRFFSYNRFYDNQTWMGLYSDPNPVYGDLVSGRGPLFVDAHGISIAEGVYIHKDLEEVLKLSVHSQEVKDFFAQPENPQGKAVVENGLLIIKKSARYHESFYFSLMDSAVSDRCYFYAKIQGIKNYCLYFLHKAKKIIHAAGKKLIPYRIPATRELLDTWFVAQGDAFDFGYKKFCFPTSFGDVFLSEQELNCLRLIAQGYTQLDMSEALLLSPKTVESYVRSVKNKLSVDSRQELVRTYQDFATLDPHNHKEFSGIL
jgi:DNA-binding CsgD family transcriptional regulator